VELIRYSGTGNTFVLADNRAGKLSDAPEAARLWCARYDVDGLLVMEGSDEADVCMRIVNPDGSEADMCGNGSRCAAHWAHHEAGLPADLSMESGAGLLKARVDGDTVRVRLTDPKDLRSLDGFSVGSADGAVNAVNTGVPHVVVPVRDIERTDIEAEGRRIRNHGRFSPAGTNVSFYQPSGEAAIRCRVYERGVERETASCGTGSAACALMFALATGCASPVSVGVRSGDTLRIHFKRSAGSFYDVWLEGPVTLEGRERPNG